MSDFTEDLLVQRTAAAYLEDVLGWESVMAWNRETLGPDGTLGRETQHEVVLTRYLRPALERLNPGFPPEVYQGAVDRLTESSAAQTLFQTNRETYGLLRDGVEVEYRDDEGAMQTARLRVFDFRTPEANHFLAVRELWVRGDVYRRRPDLVGFVNGVPLVFMEFKNVNVDVHHAYTDNLADYKDTIPHLFHHNALTVLSNGDDALVGAYASPFKFFRPWKRLHEEDAGVVDLETLLKGVCSKASLLDLVENYVLFDESGPETAKILAQNQQALGVRRAVESVRQRHERGGKLGVFWHTQGSGKSYSMAFFVRAVRRLLGGQFTFVVVTDRQDLDTQIYDTFAGCGLANNDKDPCRPASGEALEAMLSDAHKGIVFTLVQKFNRPVTEPWSTRDDIIVISDEAHRSQYGDFATNMREALPNASYIGFTGTPLFNGDELTRRIFGDYVSTYDFQRAVEDEATVPLFYDARGEKLGIETTGLNEKLAAAIEAAEVEDEDARLRLERDLKRDYHILTSEKRLNAVAKDLVRHYAKGWQTGKAMLVCPDKVTCVRMHGLIAKHWAKHITELERDLAREDDAQEAQQRQRQLAWMRETLHAVVISEDQGEVEDFRKWDLDIVPHRKLIREGFETEGGERIDMESAFKKDDHPFRLAIVCAMWLTGFDVPSLSTLYLDKPLRAHTLMQAVARANRVREGKTNGLIVDYCGILKNLRQALATYGGAADGGRASDGDGSTLPPEVDPIRPEEELLESLAEAVALVQAFLEAHGADLGAITESDGFARLAALKAAKEAINESDERRKRFEIMARKVLNTYKACFGIDGQAAYKTSRDAINIVYKSLQEDVEKADITDIIRSLHAVVDDSVTVRPGQTGEKPERLYDISQIDFERLRQEFEASGEKNTRVQNLRAAVEKQLERMMAQNPLRADFQARYEEIIEAYNSEKDRATIEQTFEALVRFVGDLDQEEQRAVREGLDAESIVLFDLIAKPDLSRAERQRLKDIAEALLAEIKTVLADFDDWQAKEATRAAVETRIYDFLYDETTGLPIGVYEEDEVKDFATRVYHHVFRAYSTGPDSPLYRRAA